MTTPNATITRLGLDASPWLWAVRIESAEPEQFFAVIDALKADIPSRRRKWDAEAKCWMFRDDSAVEICCRLLERYGLTYQHVDMGQVMDAG